MRPEECVSWQRVNWPDGSTYEGFAKNDLCHLRGVSYFADGDRYEGEFLDHQMEGFGVYHWHDGTCFKGAWHQDKMHGCGVKWTNDGAHVELAGHFSDDEYVGLSDVCDLKAAQWSAKQAQTAANVAIGLQEKVGAQGLQAKWHRPHSGPKVASHAGAFQIFQKQHTRPRSGQIPSKED